MDAMGWMGVKPKRLLLTQLGGRGGSYSSIPNCSCLLGTFVPNPYLYARMVFIPYPESALHAFKKNETWT